MHRITFVEFPASAGPSLINIMQEYLRCTMTVKHIAPVINFDAFIYDTFQVPMWPGRRTYGVYGVSKRQP